MVRQIERLGAPVGQTADRRLASDSPWASLIGEVLAPSQVSRQLHLEIEQELQELVDRGQLVALPDRPSTTVYPSFQFTASGSVKPQIPRIIAIFSGAVETPYTIVSWLNSQKSYLQDRPPMTGLPRWRSGAGDCRRGASRGAIGELAGRRA